MVGARYVPDRGDIVWLDFDPQAGHEQAGHRPALVISPATYNRQSGLGLFCPITSRVKGHPFEVALTSINGGVSGVVLSDQIKSLDWRARGIRLAHRAAPQVISDVMENLDILLR